MELHKVRHLPKSIKFHIHISDGWTVSRYYYKILCTRNDGQELCLYCQVSPMILEVYFNVTFWIEGDRWMKRYRPERSDRAMI